MTSFYASLLAMLIVQVADAVTTFIAIRQGAVERNRFIRWLQDTFGYAWIPIKIAGGMWGGWLLVSSPTPHLLWLAVAVVGYVAYRNFRLI